MQLSIPHIIIRTLFLLIYSTVITTAYSQWYTPENVLPLARKQYDKGITMVNDQQYKNALPFIEKAIAADPKFIDAYLTYAGLQGELKNYDKCITYYKQAFALDTQYTKPYLLPYSINLAGSGNFAEALKAVNKFANTEKLNLKSLQSAKYRARCYQFALDFAKLYPNNYTFNPINLGDNINTAESEYFPSITIDGSKLVFTRRVNDRNEDFYESNYSKSKWGKATPIKGSVNTLFNEGAQNISQDGSILFYTGCNFPQGQGSCDLYYSLYINGAYTKPIPAGNAINTEYWESQPCLSADKKMLYFAASDPSGYGGSDIYVSLQDNKGKWGTPRNLGTKVNTTGNESCPFIHADNQTLYFSSDGHTGYGGEDLFVSRKQPNGSWSIALNLGYPINTIENEGSLIIAANGVTAYYASDRADSRGGLDIYTFDLRPEMQPTKTLYIKGTVIDSITKQPLISTIELYDINSPNTPLQKIQTNNTANFFVTLPVGKNYLLNVTRKGYLFYSANYNFTQTPPDTTYDAILPLQPILLNATITLQNIFYETNKFALDNKSTLELSKVLQLLTDNPTVRIEIGGHTDNVGQASKNLLLSTNRSKAVVTYLVSKGINANRLVAKGYGQAKPVANNTTNEGKAGNRRTELKVIGL